MPRAGQHYPGTYAAMRAWFPDDAACLDYLDWLRWPAGFRCPSCGCTTCWELSRGERRCTDCRRRVSRTAGTIFQDTRTPLTVWFAAAWYLTTQKNGISALGLKRVLGLGSYQTAWAMLHRYRTAMVRPGRERLNGNVEADESFFGGVKPGKRGEGQPAAYLNEFCLRFNRRHSRARGLLFYRLMQLALGAPPLTYRQLVVNPQPKRHRPIAPQGARSKISRMLYLLMNARTGDSLLVEPLSASIAAALRVDVATVFRGGFSSSALP